MIIGMGVDIADPGRIERSYGRFGERFLRRIFTAGEMGYCDSKASRFQSYAARFAAKEATMKALKHGINSGAIFKEIEVLPGEPPSIKLSGKTSEKATEKGVKKIFLSLSHEKGLAIAVVILEG